MIRDLSQLTYEDRRQFLLGLTVEQRKQWTKNIIVRYPRFDDLLKEIHNCHHNALNEVVFENDNDDEKGEPACLFVGAATGSGKTTLYRAYKVDYPRIETAEGTRVPIIYARVPAPATVKNLASELLRRLGDPGYDKGTLFSKTMRLYHLIETCQVEAIFLDDLQHFIDRDSQKVLLTLSDWLKNLIGNTKKPIIAFGLPDAKNVFSRKVNPQISRRFRHRFQMEPLRWAENPDENEFRIFLYCLAQQLPLIEETNLLDESVALRFFYATDGTVGHVMSLVSEAVQIALDTNKEHLNDLSVLANAFNRVIAEENPGKINPFLTEEFKAPKNTKTDKSTGNSKSTNNRRKTQQASTSKKASDVLHT